MNRTSSARIIGEDGLQGTITDQFQADDGTTYVLVAFDSGEQVRIPTSLLQAQPDGSMFVALRRDNLRQHQSELTAQSDNYITIPVIAEELQVGKRVVETGRVRVRKVVHQREAVVDEPLFRDDVQVERVAINQQINMLPDVRREGDTVIIPVVEEILVVEKRLVLKEELHVTRRRTTVRDQQTVPLLSEELIVERLPPNDGGDAHRE